MRKREEKKRREKEKRKEENIGDQIAKTVRAPFTFAPWPFTRRTRTAYTIGKPDECSTFICGLENLHADRTTVCFEPWQKPRATLGFRKTGLSPPPHPPQVILLAVPRRCFCCGSYSFVIIFKMFACCMILHEFVATLRLSALPSALYFILSKLALWPPQFNSCSLCFPKD